MKVSRLFFFLVVTLTVFPLTVEAAPLPEISNPNLIQKEDGYIDLALTLQNPDWNSLPTLYPFIEYLSKENSAKNGVAVSLIASSSMHLAPFQKYSWVNTLKVPQFLVGSQEVSFGLRDALGNIVTKQSIGTITTNPSPLAISIGSCKYGMTPIYPGISSLVYLPTPSADIPTEPTEIPPTLPSTRFNCLLTNGTGTQREVRVKLVAYEYGELGRVLTEIEYPVVAQAGKPQLISMDLPADIRITPGNHTLEFITLDSENTPITTPFRFKFDVTGSAAAITHLRLDAPTYAAGTIAKLEYQGSVRPASWDTGERYTLEITLADNDGQKCTNESKKFPYLSSPDKIQTIEIIVDAACSEPTLTINLLDGQGSSVLIQTVSTKVQSAIINPFKKQLVVVVVMSVLILVGIVSGGFLWWRKQKNTPPPVMPSNM